jgi:GTP diphosphokinase / guanosine-3',5'-bis(diphosphate) 3'-diphosphatase
MGLAPTSEQFFAKIARNLAANDLSRVQCAWALAKAAHSGQTRQSGEPYDTHPLAVAGILFDLLGDDADALCAALLHDVVEDSDTPLASIRADFGDAVAHIVDGVSKLDSVKASVGAFAASKEDTLRKLIAAGGRDWRVFAVKLCDRLHNMRTLGPVGREKQGRVALETSTVYVPLARYVGFQQIAAELEALALRWRFPWRWAILSKWASFKSRVDRQRLVPIFRDAIWAGFVGSSPNSERVMNELVVRAFALLRADRACRALFAVPTIFDFTESIEDAHGRIARLHRNFQCLPASFICLTNEGIVSSKVLLSRQALVAEFVFLFPRIARSAHGLMIDGGVDGDDFAAVASSGDFPGSFTRVLRELMEHTSIAVFSPKGQRFSLPKRASGLDFAFAIHTDLGLRANAVRVNGRLCDAKVELSTGDIVEVIAGDKIVAVPEWEAALRSPRSRAKLRHWIRESAQDDAAMLGRRLLTEAAGLVDAEDKRLYANMQTLSQSFGVATREDLWHRIGSGELSAFAVASQLLGSGAEHLLRVTNSADVRSRLLLDGRPVAGVQYCDLCQPLAGDAILAVGSFAGIKIHRIACPRRNEGRASNDVFSPMWAARICQALPSELLVKATDRNGLLADCARVVSDIGIDVVAVTSLSSQSPAGPVATLAFTVLIRSRAKLDACLSALSSVLGVMSAERAGTSSHRVPASQ